MERIIEYIEDYIICNPEYVDKYENLTEFIKSTTMFEKLGIEKNDENIHEIEKQVRKKLILYLEKLEKMMDGISNNLILLDILQEQRDNIKNLLIKNGDDYQ